MTAATIRRGEWTLEITGDIRRLTDDDREHIAALIVDGFTSGEVIQSLDGEPSG
jgi:hypothetical protein